MSREKITLKPLYHRCGREVKDGFEWKAGTLHLKKQLMNISIPLHTALSPSLKQPFRGVLSQNRLGKETQSYSQWGLAG